MVVKVKMKMEEDGYIKGKKEVNQGGGEDGVEREEEESERREVMRCEK